MEPRLQRRVQRYGWDKAAPFYEHLWQAQLEPARRDMLQLARIGPAARVLDVACGTGLVAFEAARLAGGVDHVVGTDVSERMVAEARDRALQAGLAGPRFERMDAEKLDFPDGSFDRVLCALGLMYLPDPEAALSGFRRLLAPGGRCAVAVWGERRLCGWADVFPIIDAQVRSEVCPLFFRLGSGDALREGFEAAGFHDIAVRRMRTELHFPSADKACDAAFIGGPVALAYDRMPNPVRAEVRRQYLASIAEWGRGSEFAVPAEFVVAAGIA